MVVAGRDVEQTVLDGVFRHAALEAGAERDDLAVAGAEAVVPGRFDHRLGAIRSERRRRPTQLGDQLVAEIHVLGAADLVHVVRADEAVASRLMPIQG